MPNKNATFFLKPQSRFPSASTLPAIFRCARRGLPKRNSGEKGARPEQMAESVASSAPPPPRGAATSADALKRHPLWAAASGQRPVAGRGRGRGRPPSEAGDGGARFERISLLQLELQQAVTEEGAESALLSSDSEMDDSPKRRRGEDDHDGDYADGSDDEGARPKKAAKLPSGADAMAAAAFGGQARYAASELSDADSAASRTSSKRRKETKRSAFPVKGVRCVGCSLANRIGPVERFVSENVGRMSEVALWKLAALTWKREVAEPAQREGVEVVDWSWKEIANHFRLHTTNHVIGRTAMIQSLTAMRCQVEQCLVRVENGERTLDKANADLFLKIVAADSRERQLLAAGQAGGRGRGARPAGED